VINERTQQGDDLRVCATLELVSREPPGDTGDKVGELHSRFPPGIDKSDLGQLVSRVACREGRCDVGGAFWG
jgi:hypothetical protein